MSFTSMDLNENLLKAVQAQKFEVPTEIQQQVIPIIRSGKDIKACADTGSGKTLGYVLPVLQLLLDNPPKNQGRGPRALALAPTRELADQVTNTIKDIARYTSLKFGTITGGVGYPAQEQLLRKPLDFLVATPGRLMDHMNRGRVDFSRLEILVLDEADRMLDMGFINDIEQILEPMPAERQVLLFSATLEGEVNRISKRFLRDPACVQLSSGTKPANLITQRLHQADDYNHKRALLSHILSEPGMFQAIVFTATKRGADELADELYANQIECEALHGDMKQSKRTRTLDRMRAGRIRVLVATDVAARGIDVKSITHVVNFDFPKSVEDYIHRVGRTGRCGETGTAVSLVGPKDWGQVSLLERVTKQRLERTVITGLEPRTREQKSDNFRGGRPPGRNNDRSFRGGSGKGGPGRFSRDSEQKNYSSHRPSRPNGRNEGDANKARPPRSFDRFNKLDNAGRKNERDGNFDRRSPGTRNFSANDRPRSAFNKSDERPQRNFNRSDDRPQRSFSRTDERPQRSSNRSDDRPQRSFNKSDDRPQRSFNKSDERPKRNFTETRGSSPRTTFKDKPKISFKGPRTASDPSKAKPRRNASDSPNSRKKVFMNDPSKQRPAKKKRLKMEELTD